MSDEQFIEKQSKLLADLHPTLASVISQQAYERGHHLGYENVLTILEGLVYDFDGINILLCRGGNR